MALNEARMHAESRGWLTEPGVALPLVQRALSLIVPVRAGRDRELEDFLREQRAAWQEALQKSATVHFLRLVMLPAWRSEPPAGGARALLAFESTFDGELEPHLEELRACLGPRFEALCDFIDGFEPRDMHAFARFVRERSQRAEALLTAYPGLSRQRIREDQELWRSVSERLRELVPPGTAPHASASALVTELVRHASAFAHTRGLSLAAGASELRPKAPRPRVIWSGLLSQRWVPLIGAVVLAPWFELRDARERRRRPNRAAAAELTARDRLAAEDSWGDQNSLTHIVPIRTGAYRMFVLRLALELTSALARSQSEHGRLANGASVHFARWVILPDRRLLFSSSYDGSFESLMSSRGPRARRALTMIWTNTVGFPVTRALLARGASDRGAFASFVRAHQVPNQLYFSADPTLSVRDVRRNARLRALLGRELTPAAGRELLALL